MHRPTCNFKCLHILLTISSQSEIDSIPFPALTVSSHLKKYCRCTWTQWERLAGIRTACQSATLTSGKQPLVTLPSLNSVRLSSSVPAADTYMTRLESDHLVMQVHSVPKS